ncbi:MAG: hypothetical protein GX046_08225 [Tissierellia bacterium]|nr:hypothetical protein [Tissierellia bacterium]
METNVKTYKEKIRSNNTLKLFVMLSSLVLPIVFLLSATGIVDSDFFGIYNWLWIGFYSTAFLLLFFKKNAVNVVLIIINLAIILFGLIGSFLAGFNGFFYVIIKMLVPFIPDNWIGIELKP